MIRIRFVVFISDFLTKEMLRNEVISLRGNWGIEIIAEHSGYFELECTDIQTIFNFAFHIGGIYKVNEKEVKEIKK